jgi:hypothetical protein
MVECGDVEEVDVNEESRGEQHVVYQDRKNIPVR